MNFSISLDQIETLRALFAMLANCEDFQEQSGGDSPTYSLAEIQAAGGEGLDLVDVIQHGEATE